MGEKSPIGGLDSPTNRGAARARDGIRSAKTPRTSRRVAARDHLDPSFRGKSGPTAVMTTLFARAPVARIMLFFAFLLAAATPSDGARAAEGARPHVTRIVIEKIAHRMTLYDGDTPVRTYRVAIGPGGSGPKRQEGDNVTPTGTYKVLGRWTSQFHVFLSLNYPNADDKRRFAELKAKGKLPKRATIGGAVGIHGAPPAKKWKRLHKHFDWTAGCVAVDDDEIDEVAGLVADGTRVEIVDAIAPAGSAKP